MADNDGKSMIEFVKKIKIKDVIYMVADAWDDIPSLTITKSWNKVLHSSHLSESEVEISGDSAGSSESTDEIDSCSTLLQQLDNNPTDEEITEWISADGEDPGHQVFSDEDIIREVTQTSTEQNSDADTNEMEEVLEEDIPVITHGKAAEMLDECLRWYEQQDEATPSSLLLLKRVRDLANHKRYSNLKQTSIKYFIQQ